MAYSDEINHEDVPEKYRIPDGAENLDGHRLLLLEEVLEKADSRTSM